MLFRSSGLSFGLSRMRLVSEGLVDAWNGGRSRINSRVAAIAWRFRNSEIDLERPWLNPSNTDIDLQRPLRRIHLPNSYNETSWLEVSDRLGCRLVRDAIWHHNQCTWLGSLLIPGMNGRKAAIGTIGGDLYSGTAGIAMFLARLAPLAQDKRQRATAVAALRHALDRMRRGSWKVGAYSGLGGILHAAIAVSDALCSDEAAMVAVASLIDRLSKSKPDDREIDIIEGRAGAIRALLLAVKRKLDFKGLALETAIRFGQEVLRLGCRRDDEWSWDTTRLPVIKQLLGYSHGTSGIACALDDLFCTTGDFEFHNAAKGALKYEMSWFDQTERNWPDFRLNEVGKSTNNSGGYRFLSAWCHGAPGTALALARHVRLNPDARVQFETFLEMGIKTTIANIGAPTDNEISKSFCLCHGIAGNANILIQVGCLSDRRDLSAVAHSVAHTGAERYHKSGIWPCGTPDGLESPGLLLGLAGIGHFYLCLHDPSLPSPLLL